MGHRTRRLGVRHALRRRVVHAASPMQRAMDLAALADGPPRLTAAEVARLHLDGRHRSVASIMIRAGRLGRAALETPALRITLDRLNQPALTWAWMQRTIRETTTLESFAAAVHGALAEGRSRAALQSGATHSVAAGQRALTYIHDLRDLDHDPLKIVTSWERWVALRTQDLVTELARRQRGAAAFAAAHAGGSLLQISRALEQAKLGPTPGPHAAAIRSLEGLAAAIHRHRNPPPTLP